jgi:putative glutamine amidotransferase
VKPRIGISGYPRLVHTVLGETLLHTATSWYVDGVIGAGGVPVVFPSADPDLVDDMVDGVQGVILTGGGDVNPSCYNAEPSPDTHEVNDDRDAFDIRLLRTALERDVPVLAICRGMQVANVALGGSLIQHVPAVTGQNHSLLEDWQDGGHPVTVDPTSRLAAVLGGAAIEVNSLHHQAVCDAAPSLRPVAWAEDGTIEALETPDETSLVAVQWHPELMQHEDAHHALFADLIERAAVHARR